MNIIHPVKLAYRGVLIERPCDFCDTVDIHPEGKCSSGPCAFVYSNEVTAFTDRRESGLVCGMQRYGSRPELHHDRQYMHEWVPNTYYPADIEWSHNPPCRVHVGEDLDDDEMSRCSKCVAWGDCYNEDCAHHTARKAFDAILDCVRRESQPEHYTSDLFRDYQRLVRTSMPQFVWKLRAHGCGTDLYSPDETITYSVRGDRWFLYDGRAHGPLGDFVEVNLDTARAVQGFWRVGGFADRYGASPYVLQRYATGEPS